MTRKDYERIAAEFRRAREVWCTEPDGDLDFAAQDLAERLAAAFAEANPRFNRDRFLAACRP